MSDKEKLIDTLTRPNSIQFPRNHAEVSVIKNQFANLKKTEVNGNTVWFLNDEPNITNTKIRIYPTGHMVFYNSCGKRFLFTDPEGHPLHECEWKTDAETGKTELALVRMQLDCKQWFGIKPDANTFSIFVDFKDRPGSADLTLDDLRREAAAAWDIPISEIKYFYKDENFIPHGVAEYEIFLSKDGLYVLVDGTFDQTIFISNMPKVQWDPLDVITVVELFQSAPPGAGGAAFEFFWGLYEDQARETQPEPLRFRGLPVYPTQKAFQIFSAYFSPTAPEGEDLMDVFMDFHRSHQITWDLRPDPPWRYFSDKHSACLTVQNNFLYKVTLLDDPVALPFINCSRGGKTSCQRQVHVTKDSILLLDGDEICQEIPLLPLWKISPQEDSAIEPSSHPFSWRKFFQGSPPKVDPIKAVLAVPFYPEGASEIGEASLQPMVVDQILFYMEKFSDMPNRLEKIDRVLIHNFDTVISGCIDCTCEREYKVLFNDPEFAQKNAQLLWDYAASRNQLNALRKVSFLPEKENVKSAYKEKYGMIFRWIPFTHYLDRAASENILNSVAQALAPNALLFLVGPRQISNLFHHHSLKNIYNDQVQDMPFFLQHKKMYPETQVNPDTTVFFAERITSRKSLDLTQQVEMESADITSREVLEISLKKEREEKLFYTELAGHVANHKVREFLLSMADESDQHEKEIRKLLGENEDDSYSWKKNEAVKKLIETHFQTDIFPPLEEISKIAPQLKGVHMALDFAVEKERVAKDFYGLLGQYCNNFEAKTALILLEKIESEHVMKIESFRKDFLMEPYG